MQCSEEGCTHPAEELSFPDGAVYSVCWGHARKHGFCPGCGGFWGGVESFEMGLYGDYCDECGRNPDIVGYQPDDDEDGWDGGDDEDGSMPVRVVVVGTGEDIPF
jgi:hypothetical protein